MEQRIGIERMEEAVNLFGSFDENIRLLEAEFQVRAVTRGGEIVVSGEPENVMLAVKAVQALLTLSNKGETITDQHVRYVIGLVRSGQAERISELTQDVICITSKGRPVKPKTIGQKEYVNAILKQTVTIGVPEIGTKAVNNATNGKTLDPEARAEIKDTVSYKGLIAGEKYTVSGKLMNKATNEPLKDKDGKEITSSVTFTAEASNGTVDVFFVLDASLLRGQSIVVFESLQYKDIEIAVHADINDVDQTVTVNSPEIKTTAKNAADGKKEFWAYSKVELVDTVSYKGLIAGNKYTVIGKLMDKATGEPVLGRNNKEITATAEFEAKSSDGTVDVSFVFDASILGGKTLVVFETLTRNGTTVATHADINDVDQTVTIKRIPTYSGPSISTTATFDGKEKKNSVAGKNVKIVDTVNYTGLTVGKTYVLVGTLMDKDSGVALKDNKGNLVTATTTFTPKSSNGAVNVTFKFDASKLKDHALVVFETLYEGRAEAGNVIATHNDLMDGAQTVYFRDSVQTGDEGIGLWAMLGTFSAIACCGTAVFMFRRKKEYGAE